MGKTVTEDISQEEKEFDSTNLRQFYAPAYKCMCYIECSPWFLRNKIFLYSLPNLRFISWLDVLFKHYANLFPKKLCF